MATKHIKMVIYGEPGVGKSTFAFGAPKPFFITTDGNYEYLVDYFGANEADYKQVFSWSEAQRVMETSDFSGYETIVVDLLEDLYSWAQQEFCKKNNLQHITDFAYGKGYKMLEDDFFITLQKFLALDKNIILIMHGTSEVVKDRRGIEYTRYIPTKKMRSIIIDQIEGRVRFFLRAYAEVEETEDDRLVTKRYLSLSPDGKTEYGIARGVPEDASVPRSIPLDWNALYRVATLGMKQRPADENDTVTETAKETEPTVPVVESKPAKARKQKKVVEVVTEDDEEDPTMLDESTPAPEPASEPAPEPAPEPVPAPTAPAGNTVNAEDKLAAIKAKMAKIKAQNN